MYFNVYEGNPPADTNQFDLVTENEAAHYIDLFGSSQLLKLRNFTENKALYSNEIFHSNFHFETFGVFRG